MLDYPRWKIITVLAISAFFVMSALPNMVPVKLPSWMPSNKINLGLDLQGGSHLLLRVDVSTYMQDYMQTVRDEVRVAMRENGIGYKNLAATEGLLSFTVRPETLPEGPTVPDLLAEIDDGFDVQLNNDIHYVVTFSEEAMQKKTQELLEQSIEIINRRVNPDGTKEPTIQRQGEDRILVQVPGEENPEKLKERLGKTAKMTFHLVNESVTDDQLRRGAVPPGTRIMKYESKRTGQPDRVAVKSQVALSGELLTGANPSFDRGQPIVEFAFNTVGARKFGDITQANIGKRFAIVLDKKVITAPVIRSAILGGRGMIEGNFTVDSANELAILLRAGALPAPLDIIEERSVGPSLGADSIAAGEKAVVIAIVAVMIFMLFSYGLFGLFSDIALMINIGIIMGALSLFQATLTLPGIAGIVLTMGMAVDANTLIFERIREELRNGKSAMAAIDNGFRTAFGTILDSNITTLIAAFILFYFGSGTVKGFAVTLSIGILSSMFSAILLTRLMVITWYKSRRPKALPI
ncbi:MAG: protein translocase subunit SecD [Rickettsiales bacterium]|nr:protein translocase subunit SecD [Rickettsiales bacterium]